MLDDSTYVSKQPDCVEFSTLLPSKCRLRKCFYSRQMHSRSSTKFLQQYIPIMKTKKEVTTTTTTMILMTIVMITTTTMLMMLLMQIKFSQIRFEDKKVRCTSKSDHLCLDFAISLEPIILRRYCRLITGGEHPSIPPLIRPLILRSSLSLIRPCFGPF